MKNKATVSETLRKILLLEDHLNELTHLKESAFAVFGNMFPLNEMKPVLESSWQSLSFWNRTHKDAPHFHMQSYAEIQRIFSDVTCANINRKEFEQSLSQSCEAVEECIKNIQSQLSEEKRKLNKLYKEFAQSSGKFKFFFEEKTVKQLIINNFLKS